MSRSRSSRLALVTVATLAAAALPAQAQEESVGPQVLDLVLTSVSLDGSVSTNESDREVEVSFGADVLFNFDKASLKPAARGRIGQAAARIRKAKPGRVRVEGYTDFKGANGYNRRLSKRRAAAVARALRRDLGGTAPALVIRGRGEADPIASNTKKDGTDNPRGRARNRRVTVSFGR